MSKGGCKAQYSTAERDNHYTSGNKKPTPGVIRRWVFWLRWNS
jgi:hypothetical protein